MENTDPLYDASIVPTLYSKIGALTVRADVLAAQNEALREELARLQENNTPEGGQ